MARLPILEYPDPRLRQHAQPVTVLDRSLSRLVDDLIETLHATSGIGLSAPQTGIPQALVLIDLSGRTAAPEVYVNPKILSQGVPGLVEEGCLSIPGIVGTVVRATQLRVRALDRWGDPFERDLDGMGAVCLQHEMDHLAGRLFIDRLSLFRRLRIRLAAAARVRSRLMSAGAGDHPSTAA